MTTDFFADIELGMLPYIYHHSLAVPKENHCNSVDGSQLALFAIEFKNFKQGKFIAYLPRIVFNRKEYIDLELVIFENGHYYVCANQFSKEQLTTKALEAIKESKVLKDFIEYFEPLKEGIKGHRLKEMFLNYKEDAKKRIEAANSSLDFIDNFSNYYT